MKNDPFKYFKTSLEIIHLEVMLHLRFPFSLRNVEDLLHEGGVDVSHEAVRYRAVRHPQAADCGRQTLDESSVARQWHIPFSAEN